MTEACFQKGALEFATQTTTIRYTDGSAPELTIPVVDVKEGVVPAGSTCKIVILSRFVCCPSR